MRNLTTILVALTLASPAALSADRTSFSAQALLGRIAEEGGRKVLGDLWEREENFARVASGIESGEPSWLKVAVALRPFSDGSASLSLNYAVARALPKATDRVLALVGHGFAVEDICTSPFIEPGPGIAEAYERQALTALSKVKAPALVPVAVECSKQVRLPAGA